MSTQILESFAWTNSRTDIAGRYSIGSVGGVGIYNTPVPFSGDNAMGYNFGGFILPFVNGPFATVRLTFWVYIDQFGVIATYKPLLEFWDQAQGHQCYLGVDSNQKLVIYNADGTLLGTGSTVLAPKTYYSVDISVTINNTTGAAKVYLEGNLEINLSGVDTQNTSNASCKYLVWYAISSQDYVTQIHAEDGATADGSYRRVILLTPNGDGAHADWSLSAGATGYTLIDEIPPSTADYIYSSTPGDQSVFDFTNLPYTPANIYCVQTSLYANKDDGATRQIQIMRRIGGTDYNGPTLALTATVNDSFLQIDDVSPDTSAAWTATEVDNGQFGVQEIA